MPDSLTFAAEAAHRELETNASQFNATNLHNRVNQVLQAIMTNSQPVIGQLAAILVRFLVRTFGFFDELTEERILFVNRRLTVHGI